MALQASLDTVTMSGMVITGQCSCTGGSFDWKLLRADDSYPPLVIGNVAGEGGVASFSFTDERNSNEFPWTYSGFNQPYILMFRDAVDAEYPGSWSGPSLAFVVFTPKPPGFSILASVSSSIDPDTMEVTVGGNDLDDNGVPPNISTEWKVTRVSDGSVMVSGLGASFSGETFTADAMEWYTLTFKSPYGSWGTPQLFYPMEFGGTVYQYIEGCLFSFSMPT
jgi:hypothetical protein